MLISDVISIMEHKIAPPALAEKWDSPGLKTGNPDLHVTGILTCLDADTAVIHEAVSMGYNMIISHHPLIFGSVSDVRLDTQQAICAAVKGDIAVFSAHTNLDCAEGGINETLAQKAGIKDIMLCSDGFHRFGRIEKEASLKGYISFLKKNLGAPYLNIVLPYKFSNRRPEEIAVSAIGVSCGAFDGETGWVSENSLNILVTGEIKHSDALRLREADFITIGAGHYYTEAPGISALTQKLDRLLIEEYGSNTVPVCISKSMAPPFCAE